MAICCPKSFQTKTARFASLDDCGRPVTSADPITGGVGAIVQTNAFMELTVTPDIEEGEEIVVKTAGGEICVHNKDCDQVKGFELGLKLCGAPFPVLNMLMGVRAIFDATVATDIIGGAIPIGKVCRRPVSVGLWGKNAVKGACPIPSAPGAPIALPWVLWQLTKTINWVIDGDLSFADGALEFGLKGYAEENPYFGIGSSPVATGPFVPGAGDTSPWTATDNAVEALLWRCVPDAPSSAECLFLDAA